MRNEQFLYGLGCLLLVIGCNSPVKSSKEFSPVEAKSKAVENYFLSKLKNGKISVDNGTISIVDSTFRYVSELKGSVNGRIDADTLSDAIVPVKIYQGQTPLRVEHLIFLRSGEEFKYAASMDKIYKIRKIENNSIVAEYTDLPFDSPIYGCTECIRVYKYKLEGNSLVKTDSLKY